MPVRSTLIINDGLATPVAHSFSPSGVVGDISYFEDRSTGVAVGYPIITVSIQKPRKGQNYTKIRMRGVVPELETLGNNSITGIVPAATKAFDNSFDIIFQIHNRSVLQSKKNVLAYCRNLIAGTGTNAFIQSIIQDGETIYG